MSESIFKVGQLHGIKTLICKSFLLQIDVYYLTERTSDDLGTIAFIRVAAADIYL